MENLPSIRSVARELVIESVTEVQQKAHQRNYHKLHIYPNGMVNFFESINFRDDLIDRRAKVFRAIPSAITAGTGNYNCNCDYCQDETYETKSEAIADAIANENSSETLEFMLKRFDEIEVGYFEDEEVRP